MFAPDLGISNMLPRSQQVRICVLSLSAPHLPTASACHLELVTVDLTLLVLVSVHICTTHIPHLHRYTSLLMAEILLHKLPQLFLSYFHREGVVHEIQKLGGLLTEPSISSPIKAARTTSGSTVQRPEADDDTQPTPSLFEHCSEDAANILSSAMQTRAAALYQKYFAEHHSELAEGANVLHELKALASMLQTDMRKSRLDDEHTVAKLQNVLFSFGALLSKPQGITIFEFLSSGMLQALIQFLTFDDADTKPDNLELCARRLRAFLAVLGSSRSSASAVIDTDVLAGARMPTPSADSFLILLVCPVLQSLVLA